ncbi:CUGBP Elav-like family member 1-A isoform X2 [Ornithodoros turicata]|uniref:CUGBP Elav-like family member 1-A isoform X2 n=1 Tax=Ornithodoros turicata TaxID=34597 RepID=UPI003139E4D8
MPGHNRNKDDGNVGGWQKEDITSINKRKVYVGRIPQGTREDDILQAFENFTVEKVYLRPFTTPFGYAFVVLDSLEAASQAEQEVNGASINGSSVVVRPAAVRTETRSPSVASASEGGWGESMPEGGDRSGGGSGKERELFVGNLPSNVEEQDLVSLFETFGIEKVVLKKGNKSGKRNFAFVTMNEKSGAVAALERLKNAQLRGSKISLSFCKERSSNAPSENHMNESLMSEETSASSDSSSAVEFYVGNLPDDVTEEDVRQLFADFNVSYVQMKAKVGRAFSFVGIKGVQSPESVISTVGARKVNGKKVVVRLAGPTSGGAGHGTKGSGATSGGSLGGGDSWDSHPATTSPSGGTESSRAGASNSWGDGAATDGHSRSEGGVRAADDGPPPLEPIPDDPINENGTHSDTANGDVQTRQLYVDNLKPGICKEEVVDMFKKFGVSEVFVRSLAKKSFAFVTLHSEDQVQDAIIEMNGKTGSNGCPITVKRKVPKPAAKVVSLNDIPPLQRIVDNKEVFVANLPADVGEEDMLRLFEKYGVQEIHLTSSGAQPEAHVILSSAENAQKAVQDLHGASMCGKKLRLELIVEQNSCPAQRPALLQTPNKPVVLCIANFPYSSKEHHLLELLENFSPRDILIMKATAADSFTRAYVSVPSWEHAEDAVLEAHNTFYYGRLIAVMPMGEGTVQEIASLCEPVMSQGKGIEYPSQK